MAYTTISKISEELGGYTINASSTPSSTAVTTWITETDKLIDNITGTTYSSATASSEYYDYDGSGSLFLANSPVISITELRKETQGIDASTTEWEDLSEGRTVDYDFYLYEDEGEVKFHGTNRPHKGYKNVCVTYDYGHSSVPADIQRLSTLITAKRVINALTSNSATEEGGSVSVGTIRVSDPSSFSHKHIEAMDKEVEYITRRVGKFKTYRFKRTYDNY